MTIRSRNILIASIVLAISLAIASFITILISKENKAQEEIEMKYAKLESELSSLKKERNEVALKISIINSKLEGQEYNLGSTMILITDAYSYFLDDIYPYLDNYGYSGIITLGSYYFINSQNMMTTDEICDLVNNHRYELSMSLNESTNITDLYSSFQKKGLPNPTMAYYPNNDYSSENIDTLNGLGITTVIGYNGTPSIVDDTFFIRAYGSYTDNTKEEFMNAVNYSVPFCITIGYKNAYEQYSASNLSNMISTLKTYEDQSPVTKTAIARTRYQEYLDTTSTDKDELKEERIVLERRFEELRLLIAEKSKE